MVRNESYRINKRIKADKLRVIDKEGEQVGVMSKEEALTLAREKGMDLVEVAPAAKPPVARVLDYKKWQFEKRKKEKKGKKEKKTELKELRFGPNIGDHDLNLRVKRTREFLKGGDKVKLTVTFRGRQHAHPEVGLEKIQRVIELTKEEGKPEKDPERIGHGYEVILVPA